MGVYFKVKFSQAWQQKCWDALALLWLACLYYIGYPIVPFVRKLTLVITKDIVRLHTCPDILKLIK